MHVFPVNESHRDTGATSTPGSPDAVEIRFVVFGDRVVDDVCHVVNIDSTSGNVGRNQNVFLARFERGH